MVRYFGGGYVSLRSRKTGRPPGARDRQIRIPPLCGPQPRGRQGHDGKAPCHVLAQAYFFRTQQKLRDGADLPRPAVPDDFPAASCPADTGGRDAGAGQARTDLVSAYLPGLSAFTLGRTNKTGSAQAGNTGRKED